MKIKRIYRCGDYRVTVYSNGEKHYKKIVVRTKKQMKEGEGHG